MMRRAALVTLVVVAAQLGSVQLVGGMLTIVLAIAAHFYAALSFPRVWTHWRPYHCWPSLDCLAQVWHSLPPCSAASSAHCVAQCRLSASVHSRPFVHAF